MHSLFTLRVLTTLRYDVRGLLGDEVDPAAVDIDDGHDNNCNDGGERDEDDDHNDDDDDDDVDDDVGEDDETDDKNQ